ncbi:hypothetical protein AQJ91_05220 [Streptomyces dysideae]|uniref:Uncharacterized protein n=1 Tax=Streptomyces dysideae TaxID=909626 RepID=A0A124IFN3_9ACTN|nr:hypothetical protein AQJ91_05220 [Streptomyces dysideae]
MSRYAVLGSSTLVKRTNAAGAAETRSRLPARPQAMHLCSRSRRVFFTRSPHRQCWDRAVDQVEARTSRPPAASHSTLRAEMSMPGVVWDRRLPHSRYQVRMSQSSTTSTGPWAAAISRATRRARRRRCSAIEAACSA